MERIFVKPNPKWPLIRHPDTLLFLKPEGELVPRNTYWIRRIRMQDVILADPPKKDEPPKKAATPRKKGEK